MAAPLDVEEVIEKVKKLQEKCDLLRSKEIGDVFLGRCSERCQSVLDRKAGPGLGPGQGTQLVKDILQDYTQALLDLTFYEENKLVDEEFPEADGKERLHSLLGDLTKPEEMTFKIFGPDVELKVILGEELTECLLWRRGALLYMYCSCVQENPQRVLKDTQHFLQCGQEGVRSLQCMLEVRVPLQQQRAQVVTNDEDTFSLLQKGVFSDTHVLALMYAGELCYWVTQLYKQQGGASESSTVTHTEESERSSMTQTGISLLGLYIELATGLLRGKGWTTDRATDLLQQFQS